MIHGPAIQFFVFVSLLLMGLAIEAFILDLSCLLYNKITGAEPARYSGVPRPGLEKAGRILFVTLLVNATATFILLRVRRLLGYGGPEAFRTLSIYLAVNPLGVLVLGIVNTLVLPTTFVRGMLVALIAAFFGVLAAAALIALYLLVVMAVGGDALPFD